MSTILVVEDDFNTRHGLGEILADEGYDVVLAENAGTALEKVNFDTDLLLADLKLPGLSGLDLVDQVKQNYPDLVSVIMTAYSAPEILLRAKELGVFSCLNKPLNIELFLSVLKKALKPDESTQANTFNEVTVIE